MDQKTPAEIRAEARAAKVRAREEATAAHHAAVEAVAQNYANWCAGVRGIGLCAVLEEAARAAAMIPDLPARTARLLELARATSAASACELTRTGSWVRQNGAFLRSSEALTVGSFATGIANKPKKTRRLYCLASVRSAVLVASTAAEIAGADAADTFAQVWARVTTRAEEIAKIEAEEAV